MVNFLEKNMIGQNAADADSFDLVHSMVESDQPDKSKERRDYERQNYNCV